MGADESHMHHVLIKKSFALGRTEITQFQWRAVMQDQSRSIIGNDPSYFSSCGEDCPVERVSWNNVQIFIQKLNAKTRKQYRLPSEAEWECACRAGDGYEYCGDNSLESVAWHGMVALLKRPIMTARLLHMWQVSERMPSVYMT